MTNNMRWFAVRCCCTPVKVIGFLRLEDVAAGCYKADRAIFDRDGVRHLAEVMPLADHMMVPYKLLADRNIADHNTVRGREYAVYSDDRPLSFWRTITGFIANPEYRE